MSSEDQVELIVSRQVMPKLNAIQNSVVEFNGTLNGFIVRQNEERQENRDSHEGIVADIKKIQATLNGNGKEGLLTTVSKLSEWREDQKKLQAFLLTAVLGEVVALVFLLIKLYLTTP